MIRKRNQLRSKSNRKKSNRSRVGSRMENLESRKMMFTHGVEECIDFEDLGAADSFVVGDSFLADNTGFQGNFQTAEFQWSNGVWTSGGIASTGHANWANDVGQELVLNNINVEVEFSGSPVAGLTMKAGEYGGNVNLMINGDFRNFEDFQDINGALVGGVAVNVVGGGFGNDAFHVQFDGAVDQFMVGGQEFAIDHICLGGEVDDGHFDWGDAPDQPYPTLKANFGAHHRVNPDVFLGTTIDVDPNGQPTVASSGDDADGNDDEDGIRMLTPMVPGSTATVEVMASTDGFLNAWIDFKGNGDWSDPGDQVFSGQPLTPGANVLTFHVPDDAIQGRNYSRWRFSTTHKELGPSQSPREEAPDGEVEDHLLRVGKPNDDRLDWGDAPDEPYPTLEASRGARHLINPDVFLGTTIDAEPDGQPDANAMGDDAALSDDEDGVRFLSPLVPGTDAKVEVIASTDGYLNAWVDFDRNGIWAAAPEKIFEAEILTAGVNVLTFHVPADAKVEPNEATFSRWRFSTTDRVLPPFHPGGEIPDGEVEDHLAFIDEPEPPRLDWGDAPDEPYPTLEASRGARHLINPDVFLGTTIDAEPDGQPDANAMGDDAALSDDEDGVRFLTPLVPGQVARVEVTASTRGFLNAWVDFDRNGIWTAAPEKIFEAEVLGSGVNVLSFVVPASATIDVDPTYSRWRFSTTDRFLTPYHPGGEIPNGEVEDHTVKIEEGQPNDDRYDFGDAPSREQGFGFPTTLAENGARHLINPDVFLGTSIDAEPDGQPSINARRDDFVTSDDEDGVRFVTPWVAGTIAKTDILASTDGYVDAWVDLNQDGSWDASEKVMNSVPVAGGLNHVDFKIPEAALPNPQGEVYSRFRFSTTGGLDQGGAARNGEVEDYVRRLGDANDDGTVDVQDIDSLCHSMHSGNAIGDLNGDGVVDDADLDVLVHEVIGTHYGDANLDLIFDSTDLIQVFAFGQYEDGVPMNSNWSSGDFNCDGEFDSTDLVKAFADGAYVASAMPTPASLLTEALLVELRDESGDDKSDSAADVEAASDPVRRRQVLELASIDSLFESDAGQANDDRGGKSNVHRDRLGSSAVDNLFALL